MSEFIGITQAPSNIALIKYMGKKDGTLNIPENESLSLTLRDFCTFTAFKSVPFQGEAAWSVCFSGHDPREWVSETHSFHVPMSEWVKPDFSEEEKNKTNKVILRLLPKVIDVIVRFGFSALSPMQVELRTANTFPASAGIASSASSQASITLALFLLIVKEKELFQNAYKENGKLKSEIASVSRQASGSSCRSFFGPWVTWEGEFPAPFFVNSEKTPKFTDLLLLVSGDKKSVSSSEAHKRIKTSPNWSGRFERASERLSAFRRAIVASDYKKCAHISISEALDMHDLFHSSEPSFSYFLDETKKILQWFEPFLESEEFPPFLTLDAGPNIHLIVQSHDAPKWIERVRTAFPGLQVLVDEEGLGASIIFFSEIGAN